MVVAVWLWIALFYLFIRITSAASGVGKKVCQTYAKPVDFSTAIFQHRKCGFLMLSVLGWLAGSTLLVFSLFPPSGAHTATAMDIAAVKGRKSAYFQSTR